MHFLAHSSQFPKQIVIELAWEQHFDDYWRYNCSWDFHQIHTCITTISRLAWLYVSNCKYDIPVHHILDENCSQSCCCQWILAYWYWYHNHCCKKNRPFVKVKAEKEVGNEFSAVPHMVIHTWGSTECRYLYYMLEGKPVLLLNIFSQPASYGRWEVFFQSYGASFIVLYYWLHTAEKLGITHICTKWITYQLIQESFWFATDWTIHNFISFQVSHCLRPGVVPTLSIVCDIAIYIIQLLKLN